LRLFILDVFGMKKMYSSYEQALVWKAGYGGPWTLTVGGGVEAQNEAVEFYGEAGFEGFEG
jgi:hypothetical protein